MIIKNYEINKINVNKNRNFLLYGENQGLKDEIISSTFKKNYQGAVYSYEESDLIKNNANEIHAFKTLSKKSVMLALTAGVRGGKDYEKDTFRVDSIIPK